MKTSRNLTPKQAAQQIDFMTLDRCHVQAMPERYFNAISDELEDRNNHSENTVFLALRVGTDADIDEARNILAGHWKSHELTPDLSRRRYALLNKLSGITVETEAEKIIPPAVATVTVPRELLEQLSIVCFMSAPHYCPSMPEIAKAKLEKLANQCFAILTP